MREILVDLHPVTSLPRRPGRGRRRLSLLGSLLAVMALACLRVVGQEVSPARARVESKSHLLVASGRFEKAKEILETALRSAGPGEARNELLTGLAWVQSEWGDALQEERKAKSAIPHFKEALAIRRRVGDRDGEASALRSLSSAYDDLGDQRKATACFAQARAILRDLYKPSLGRQAWVLVVGSVAWLFAFASTSPLETLPLLLLLGGISAVASRLSNAPMAERLAGGTGLGMTAFLSCTTGMGWLTGEIGDPFSLSGLLLARLCALAFAGVVAWTAVRGTAGLSGAWAPGKMGRISVVLMRFGAVFLAGILLLDLAALAVYIVARPTTICFPSLQT